MERERELPEADKWEHKCDQVSRTNLNFAIKVVSVLEMQISFTFYTSSPISNFVPRYTRQ